MDATARTDTRSTQPRARRPVFFHLLQIRLPVTAIVSIGHRVSGVVLALSIPALAYLLQLSLRSAESFSQVAAFFRELPVRVVVVLLVWALAHHVLAGVRHLLFDIHVGTGLRAARVSAWLVFAIEFAVVIVSMAAMS